MPLSHASEDSTSPPMAGGAPISEAAADAAAQWLTLLMSGEATDEEHQCWEEWRSAHPDHERAWRHIESVVGRIKVMEPRTAYKTLSPYAHLKSPVRRKAINLLLSGAVISASGLLASRTRTWETAVADYRTGTGEQRTVMLSDGTRVMLGTATAINVRFNARQRFVQVVAGDVLVVTGHPVTGGVADTRSFIIQTDEGQIRALGTRFTVRQDDGRTAVAVLESAVEITPDNAPDQPQVLHAGERTTFTRQAIDAAQPASGQELAWTQGQIVADNMRLADFLAELARYLPGIVRCEGSVADLRLSGVFPLHDPDRILAILPKVLPVQVRLRTRYWVTVEAAS